MPQISEQMKAWAESSPLEAADFNLKHPEQCDPVSIDRVLHEWATPARQDEVLNWVLKLPQGKLRDISLNVAAQKFARRSPQRAWELALEISSQVKSFKENALMHFTICMINGTSKMPPQLMPHWSDCVDTF
jgi:hypothetical protein